MRLQGTRRQIALQTMLLPLDRQLQCSASLNFDSVVAIRGAREGANIGLTVAAAQSGMSGLNFSRIEGE